MVDRDEPFRDVARRFEDIRRIAVLRGGGIGDLLSAFPALVALRATYPGVHITLLTTPLLAGLLDGRPGPYDSVRIVPVFPEAPAPERVFWRDDQATLRLVDELQAERLDLAIQMHGGGRNSNPFVLALGAAHAVGCSTPDAPRLDRQLPHVYYQREVERWLEVAGLAGAAVQDHEPRFLTVGEDRDAAQPWLDPEARGLVIVHPGASDPRRRWPAERFAEIVAALAQEEWQVLLVGDTGEKALAEGIADDAARAAPSAAHRIGSAAGRTDLHGLVGLLDAARLVIANDSGPRHLAQALGTPTASVYWGPNLVNAGPPQRRHHRVQVSWRQLCPVCGADGTDPLGRSCPHEQPWVADVPAEGVLADAHDLLNGD
ncbi:glycosyltransferase family 9 protein [Sinomonas notoginsengisoli]|uniref:glycosyltransferase family 9 protein n=1 Tax=Sinomonas notoginsengisoli TaxID=1457311 RepID=UPI001F3A723D|nr:glycosyltransferase family 9 protein [Sinomonas notoginsengisoli]